MKTYLRPLITPVAAVTICLAFAGPLQAQSTQSGQSSALAIAVSVAAPVALLSGAVSLTVVAVESTVDGTVWLLQRASDGARVSVRFAAGAVGSIALSAGTVLAVTVVESGTILSNAGTAIAFIPSAVGKALLHNEQITGRPSAAR